jgi:large subunit ribosomal protein L27
MATSKSSGGARLGRDSQPKYLGVKISEGEKAMPGMIIVRQRGTRFVARKNAKMGGDNTVYAVKEGKVSFTTKKAKKFDKSSRIIKLVDVS